MPLSLRKTALLCVLLAGPATAESFAVGPQYDTSHVYVAEEEFDAFVSSLIGTFGGSATPKGSVDVTPTESETFSQLLRTPVGTISAFGFETPIPYPFGAERNGYLVTDLDAAVAAMRDAGAIRLVENFADPIGRDVLVQWPGGVNMQFYWHAEAPDYADLATVPQNRVYLTPDAADAFVESWTAYSEATVVSDEGSADAAAIGRPGEAYRRIELTSGYGDMVVTVSDGHLPWPYGRETTGYRVADLAATLERARANGVEVLVEPATVGDRDAAMVRFPGGYIAEVHARVE